MEENLDKGCVVEVVIPTLKAMGNPLTNETMKAVVIEVNSYMNDYEPGNKIYYTLMLYAQNMLFYATYTYEETYYPDEDEWGNPLEGYVDKECSPLTFKSIIATDVIMPKVDEQLKEYK
jgi:hypothetical protein